MVLVEIFLSQQLQDEVIIMTAVLGIDVSSSTSMVALMVDGTRIKEFKICNDAVGFSRLKSELNNYRSPQIVFEATGVYSRRLAFFLQTNGYDYTQLNPLQAKKEMDGLRVNKTDKNEAYHLAETQFRLDRAKTVVQDPVYSELMDQSRFYQEIISDLVTEKNRLHRILQLTFPEIESLLSHPSGQLYWHLIIEFPISTLVDEYDLNDLMNIILKLSEKNISVQRAQKIAVSLTKLASIAVPAVRSDSLDVHQVQYHAQRLLDLQHKQEEIVNSMKCLAKRLPEYEILCSIPGISTTTATSLIGEIGDIRRFSSPNQVNAYIGIDLRHYESGNFAASDTISKRGNPYARKILYRSIGNIASASRTHPTHINDYYQKKKQSSSSKGAKKIAIAAVGRLIRTIYHLVLNNETYDYTKTQHGKV